MASEMMRILATLQADNIKPRSDGSCDQEECAQYDGKRCRAIGSRPDRWCEPWIDEMRKALAAKEPSDG